MKTEQINIDFSLHFVPIEITASLNMEGRNLLFTSKITEQTIIDFSQHFVPRKDGMA